MHGPVAASDSSTANRDHGAVLESPMVLVLVVVRWWRVVAVVVVVVVVVMGVVVPADRMRNGPPATTSTCQARPQHPTVPKPPEPRDNRPGMNPNQRQQQHQRLTGQK